MSSDLVSIIVPVYNVENYIKKCVQSLVEQKYDDIEIILVDDGSPDKSPAIIDELAACDRRIRVIHQSNQGVSAARNAGIRHSSGSYIMFVDGDDWVDSEYVSYFLNLVKKSDALIGMNKNNYSTGKLKTNNVEYTVSGETAIEWLYSGELFVAVWNKIYSSKLLKKNNIMFAPDIWYGEGMLFNIQCLQYTDRVAIGEKSVYHQTYNPDSAMRKFNLNSNLCGIRSLDIQRTIWKKVTPEIEDAWRYHKYRFNRSIINGLFRADMVSEHHDLYTTCIKNIRKDIAIPLTMEKSIKTKIVWILYFVCPSLMAKHSVKRHRKLLKNSLGGN